VNLSTNLSHFQSDHKSRFPDMNVDGVLDAVTRDALKLVHDDTDPSPRAEQRVIGNASPDDEASP
jgi:hypothetical protein